LAGVSTVVAREDHKHDIDTAAPVTVTGSSNIDGLATSVSRSDHQHRLGLLIDEDGVSTGPGRPEINFIGPGITAIDNPGLDRVDVVVAAAVLTDDPPTQIDIGDVADVGVGLTAARSDHQHALPDPAVVSTLTPDNAPSLGASTLVAREDHKHGLPADAPITVRGPTNAEGVAASVARSDHDHRLELEVNQDAALIGARPALNFTGNAVVVNDDPGNDWVDIEINAVELTEDNPTRIDIGDAPVVGISNKAAHADHQHELLVPTVVATLTPDNAPALGVSAKVAREDHVHGIAADVAVTTGSTNTEGVSASFSRADHVHIGTVAVQDEGVAVSREPIIDFVGAGVTATAGAGKVTVTIPGGGSDTDTTLLTWGNSNVGAAADTRYLSPGRDNSAIAVTTDVAQVVMTRAGTVSKLWARHNAAAGNGNAVVYTVMKNGAATGITVSLVTGAIGQASDLVNTVAVAVGDRLSIQASKASGIAGGAVEAQISLEVG
jgi:hypothetical protein